MTLTKRSRSIRDWWRKARPGFRLTAKQRFVVQRFLLTNTCHKKVTKLDHAVSFLVVSWGTFWFVYILFLENMLEVSNTVVVGPFIGIVNIAITGVIWAIYKYAQYTNRIEVRLMTFQALWMFIQSFAAAFALVVTVVVTAFLAMPLCPGLDVVNTIALPLTAIGAFLWGYAKGRSCSANSEIARNLIRGGRRRAILDRTTQTLSMNTKPEDVVVEICNGFICAVYSIWWTLLLFIINSLLTLGIVMGLLGIQVTFLSLFGNPVFVASLVLILLLGMGNTARSYNRQYRDALTKILAFSTTGSPRCSD